MTKYLAFVIAAAMTLFIINSCENAPSVSDEVATDDSAVNSSLSGNVPTEVVFPPDGPSESDLLNRPAFDEFSWQMFIALSWPAKEGERGVPMSPDDPNTFLKMSNTTPVVWTSYKNQWDLFNQGSNKPSAWNSDTDPIEVCKDLPTGHNFLGTMAGELNESFSVPLVDQNKNYVYFEIRYNKVQYDFVRDNELYDNKKLYDYQQSHDNQVQMPISTDKKEGAIMVKAAWKILEDDEDDSRYYVINEPVYDPVVDKCHTMKLGLIGFHIAQKVDGFSQWVWSSFEQIDNVPGSKGGKAPYSLNNNKSEPSTGAVGFANKPSADTIYQDKNDRTPVQTARVNEIPTTPTDSSTVDINAKYQKMVEGTWMQYYELVITQWPTNDASFKLAGTNRATYPKDCGQAFPVDNCVNTTMETYFQTKDLAAPAAPFSLSGGNSCMGCHYGSSQTDFSFSLKLRTHNLNIIKED